VKWGDLDKIPLRGIKFGVCDCIQGVTGGDIGNIVGMLRGVSQELLFLVMPEGH
jgi:hypothetical protein